MAKGRTRNKRARKPEVPVYPVHSQPPPYPVAYFKLSDNRHGWADAWSGGRFYQPSEPVTQFIVHVTPDSATRLEWNRVTGWTGEVNRDDLSYIIPQIERSFSPACYRFKLNLDQNK